jgi:MFS family permease
MCAIAGRSICTASLSRRAIIRPATERVGTALRVCLPEGSVRVPSDERALGQIALNLLAKAVRFTLAGGLGIALTRRDGEVGFSVFDTGIDIAKEHLVAVFEPFGQGDTSLQRRHEGTGLGLAITTRLVALGGGTIALNSELSVDTAVHVRLPAGVPLGAALPAEAAVYARMGRPARRSDAGLPRAKHMHMSLEPSFTLTPKPAWNSRVPRVFRHRNYRLFFTGQLVSLLGTWMQNVALGWLVFRLSHSPLLLGLVTFLMQAPIFFISPLAGTLADRLDRRWVFVTTQSLCMLQAAILTALTLTHAIGIPAILVLALAVGVVTAVETPTRQSFTIEMVGREDLRQAIAFNAMMINLARTLGPAIGGVLVAAIGEGLCFLLNTISFAAVLTSLLLMRIERRKERAATHPFEDMKRGIAYVARHDHIRMVLILAATSACFGTSYLWLMPAFAKDVLHQGSQGLGYLMSAFGVGALLGALMVARLSDRHLPLTPTLMAVFLGGALILFANAPSLPIGLALVVPTGFAYIGVAVSSNTQIQLLTEDAMRGRVLAFYSMGTLGSPPLGALFLGYVADYAGVAKAFMLGGAICLIAAAISFGSLRRRGLLASIERRIQSP